jgi:hypothetical protein
MALFEAHEDNEDQGRYREHQEDEMRAVKFDLTPLPSGSHPGGVGLAVRFWDEEDPSRR